jgi:hypothetical protein
MASTTRPRAASDMPRTLRQLWADEDDAHARAFARRQRAARLRAKQGGQPRRSVVVIHRKAHAANTKHPGLR